MILTTCFRWFHTILSGVMRRGSSRDEDTGELAKEVLGSIMTKRDAANPRSATLPATLNEGVVEDSREPSGAVSSRLATRSTSPWVSCVVDFVGRRCEVVYSDSATHCTELCNKTNAILDSCGRTK